MVISFLQSLVPATPGIIGATFLRPVYEDLNALVDKSGLQTKQSYYCVMNLSKRSQLCLQCWMDAITLGLNRQSQPTDMATLGIA